VSPSTASAQREKSPDVKWCANEVIGTRFTASANSPTECATIEDDLRVHPGAANDVQDVAGMRLPRRHDHRPELHRYAAGSELTQKVLRRWLGELNRPAETREQDDRAILGDHRIERPEIDFREAQILEHSARDEHRHDAAGSCFGENARHLGREPSIGCSGAVEVAGQCAALHSMTPRMRSLRLDA
jgi:hypothetical protein